MNIGIMGCGSIAGIITDSYLKGNMNVDIKYFYDYKYENAVNLANKIDAEALDTIDELIEKSDLIVETASQSAVKENALKILENGRDMVILSVGALMDKSFYEKLKQVAEDNGATIHIPSGAVTGIDTIKAAKGHIQSISLTTSKPPQSLDLEITDNKAKILFEGKASEAVELFPKNINVSSTLSLASGIDIDVKIVADPNIKYNTHEVRVIGRFGELTTTTSNISCSNNPKTSALAAYSAISLLNSLNKTVKIGS